MFLPLLLFAFVSLNDAVLRAPLYLQRVDEKVVGTENADIFVVRVNVGNPGKQYFKRSAKNLIYFKKIFSKAFRFGQHHSMHKTELLCSIRLEPHTRPFVLRVDADRQRVNIGDVQQYGAYSLRHEVSESHMPIVLCQVKLSKIRRCSRL